VLAVLMPSPYSSAAALTILSTSATLGIKTIERPIGELSSLRNEMIPDRVRSASRRD